MRPFRPTALCAKFHTILCTKIATANSMPSPEIIFNYRVFSTKLCAHQIFRSREFRTIF